MNVIRLHAPKDLRLHEESLPQLGSGETLVRVKAVGICGSDLHWFSEAGIGDSKLQKPLVLGHEFAGVIAEGSKKGIRVAVDPAIPCNACEYCQQGNPSLCVNLRFAGHGLQDGALREYVAWPDGCLFPLPDSLSDADGAMLEPLGVAIHAVDLAHIRAGMSVGVFGCGPIGQLVIQMARLGGAINVFVTEPLCHRLESAISLGAREWTSDQKVDVAFEVAGENDAVETACSAVKPGGQVILAGIPADDRTSFTASVARRKGLTIKLVRRMKFTYPRAIRLVESGRVDVRSLVTHHFPLENALEAFSVAQRRDGLKIIIDV
ncbi:MAG TPA: alcohol dehydrogenase catalytic domain-containing protein [Anaerolineales bacterium]